METLEAEAEVIDEEGDGDVRGRRCNQWASGHPKSVGHGLAFTVLENFEVGRGGSG